MSESSKQDVSTTESEGLPESVRIGAAITLGILAVPALLGLIAGGVIVKIAIVIIALSMVHGWWRGFAEAVSLVVGLMLAILLAQLVGGWIQGPVASLTGTGGLLNRMLSVAIAGLLILMVSSMCVSIPVKRWLKARESWRQANRLGGAAVGLIEGTILALAFIWTPLALEPVAAMQVMDDAVTIDGQPIPPNPLAQRVLWLAEKSRESAVGRGIGTMNPIASTHSLTIAGDFLRLTQDEGALRRFNESDVAHDVLNMPSVEQALDILQSDQALMSRIDEEGASPSVIRELLESPTVLRILDETTIVKDLTGSLELLEGAMQEALEEGKAEMSGKSGSFTPTKQ